MSLPPLPTRDISFDEMALVKFFKRRGWITEDLHAGDVDLVDVLPGAAVACGDGRLVIASSPNEELKYTHGPKIFGGIAGVAALIGDGTIEGFRKAIKKVESLHYLPGSHGDNHKGVDGCGHMGLWQKSKFSSLLALQINLQQIRDEILAHKGIYVDHLSHHTESTLDLNWIPNRTQIPNGMRFLEDLWFVRQITDNNPEMMNKAYQMIAETVENLSSTVRTVRIIH
ncbi:MAG: cadmium-containing carbonic anhydrase [Anaerolineaceae bacterium]|nr:cadmium-containing carbonic anhydrase [Anaerolineaceae bacterium]